ncbi:MAG: LGFP repeat-containing protein [Steroidobacteraceae bacterium]
MRSISKGTVLCRGLTLLAGLWLCSRSAQALPCSPTYAVPAAIQHRWDLTGGSSGPLGCPTANSLSVSDGTLQQFDHGQIAFSPDQGTAMTVALYQSGRDVVFEWGDTYPYRYDKFLLRWDRDGTNVGQWDDPQGFGSSGLWHLPLPQPGLYTVVVEGCQTHSYGGSSCDHHWTLPVSVQYFPPDIPVRAAACAIPATGLIYARWNDLNLDGGRLGCPISAAHSVSGTSATAQEFDHGQIVLDPDRGSNFTVVGYQAEDDVVVEWGPTDPFSYDAFNVLWSKDGSAAPQVEVDPAQTPDESAAPSPDPPHNLYGAFNRGVYSIRGVGPGTYVAQIEGCDKGTFSSTCRQSWSTAVSVPVSLHRPYYTSCNKGPSNIHQPYPPDIVDIIFDHWSRLVGDNGPLLGCPVKWQTTPDHPESLTLLCEYGAIVWSPNQGSAMSVAVWQSIHRDSKGTFDGYAVWIDASDSFPYTYDGFLLRVNDTQSDLLTSSDGSKISGLPQFDLTDSGGVTLYSKGSTVNVSLEGCDTHTLSSSSCDQGWTVPINYTLVTMTPFVTPDSVVAATADPRYVAYTFPMIVPAATDKTTGDTLMRARGLTAASRIGCSKTLGAIFQDEQDFGTGVLAKLEMYNGGLVHCGNFHPAAVSAVRERPWLVVDEANAALRFQRVQSHPGTTGCGRTGEYDVVLPRLIAALMGFGNELDSDTRDHILNGLLNLRGPIDPEDISWSCAGTGIPETENHLNNMESSRYLTNQLLYAQSGDPLFDNETNGMSEWWLARLKTYLQSDFIEYNSKTYQSYSDISIQNLADYANDRRVRTAARAVLDYIAAKYAISSIGLRRNAPYRRHPGDYNNVPVPNSLGEHDLLGHNAETQNGRFTFYTGLYAINAQVPVAGGRYRFDQSYASDMVLAYAGQYRPAESILDFFYRQNALDPATTGSLNFERIHHAGVEIYSGRPQYLISAGGIWTPSPYHVFTVGQSDDQGAAVITSLIPAGSGLMSDDLIRFTGPLDGNGQDAEYLIGKPNRLNTQTCVGPDFACGYNLEIPSPLYVFNPACTVEKAEMCAAVTVSNPTTWTFLNRADDLNHCVSPAPAGGFFVAIHQPPATVGDRPGTIEAYPANAGTTFDQFVLGVCDRNGAQTLVASGNTYVTTSGATINFSLPNVVYPDAVSLIGNKFGTTDGPMDSWPLASGTLLNGDGQGKVVFHDPAATLTLTLDLTDASEPIWSEE